MEEIIINTIDGKLFALMMISGANNLYNNKKIVDELNVFPVPDGDTGTNMSLTSRAMAKALDEYVSLSAGKAADIAANATLRGARGNSGVILSQFYRGIAKSLKGKDLCTAKEFAQALKEGSDTAYKAVMNPTEGTILTVAKEAAAKAVSAASASESIEDMLEGAVNEAARALANTPNLLPALRQAGVVDAGGKGWTLILEGALEFIKTGKVTDVSDMPEQPMQSGNQTAVLPENIKYRYCTEFIIEKRDLGVNVMSFRRAIEKKGDCMLVIDDSDIVKVHIHTNNPGFVLEKAVIFGELINIKIDNMKHQHQNIIEKSREPEKEYGFIGVCAGGGMEKILKDLGVDYIIEGGQTMNPSTDDIANALKTVNARTIFVFPNNKNIILAANQAKELSDRNVYVIPSKSVPQCISAMLVFDEKLDAVTNESRFLAALESVRTGYITYAVRNTTASGISISEGDILGIVDGEIKTAGSSPDKVCTEIADMFAKDDAEFISIYYGEETDEASAQKLMADMEERYPDVEISCKYGGQPIYYYIISAE